MSIFLPEQSIKFVYGLPSAVYDISVCCLSLAVYYINVYGIASFIYDINVYGLTSAVYYIYVYDLTSAVHYINVYILTSAMYDIYVYGLTSAVYYINVYGLTSPTFSLVAPFSSLGVWMCESSADGVTFVFTPGTLFPVVPSLRYLQVKPLKGY